MNAEKRRKVGGSLVLLLVPKRCEIDTIIKINQLAPHDGGLSSIIILVVERHATLAEISTNPVSLLFLSFAQILSLVTMSKFNGPFMRSFYKLSS